MTHIRSKPYPAQKNPQCSSRDQHLNQTKKVPQREIQAQRPLSQQREVPAQQPPTSHHQDGRQREVQAQQPFSGQGVLGGEQLRTQNECPSQNPKSVVPCPFLFRRGRCVKGVNCDFSHSNLESNNKKHKTFCKPKHFTPCPFLERKGSCLKVESVTSNGTIPIITKGKHQVNTETGGDRSAEFQYNWNRSSTNPHSDGFESMPTDGDVTKSTALTATNEHTPPLFFK